MGDNLGPNGLSRGCRVFLLQIDEAEIVAHEADEPNAFVDFLDCERRPARTVETLMRLRCLPMRPGGGDEAVAIVEGIGESGRRR